MKITEILFMMVLSMLNMVGLGFLAHYKIITSAAQGMMTLGICVALATYFYIRRKQ